MRYRIITYIATSLLLFTVLVQKAEARSGIYFDTDAPSNFLSLGVRASINNSNVTPNYGDIFTDVSSVSGDWGYSFNAGVVANINFRNYFSLQPGLFFSNQCYDTNIITLSSVTEYFSYIKKHHRYYYLQIPVMASFKMHLFKGVELLMEAGPYLAFGLGGKTNVTQTTNSAVILGGLIDSNKYSYPYFGKGDMKNVQMKKHDWGVKMGAGFRFAHRCSIALYYMAGCKNIAQPNQGYERKSKAKNKEWMLSIGYDF